MTRPTPPERARITGNPGKRALRVMDGAGWDLAPLPSAPAHLEAAGLAAWAIMARCPWITGTDAVLADLFAGGLDRRARFLADIAAQPYVPGSQGQLRAHPAAVLIGPLEAQLERWARLLILSPDDRGRVGLTAARTRTTLDELQERRNDRMPHRRPGSLES